MNRAGLLRVLLATLWVLALGAQAGLLEPLPSPDLGAAEPLVRQTLEQARTETQALLGAADIEPERLGRSFGDLGRLYDAHLMLDAAAACYRNAVALDLGDYRWPYYLGYLLQRTGPLEDAAAAYGQALSLAPDSALVHLRLGQVELELGRLQVAEPHLEPALAEPGLQGAAWFGLGQLAYAQDDPALAVQRLQKALAASPRASRIHYTLALAYRSLGDMEQARTELARHGDLEPEVSDPLVEQVAELSSGQRIRFYLGSGAAQQGEYAQAARYFRDGLALDPDNLDARISLARFLHLAGQHEAAGFELRAVLAQDPGQVLANFLLGLWYAEHGEPAAAKRHLAVALEREPLHSGSHFYLGELAAAAGETREAARRYALALEQAPENSAARLRWILASIDLGEDHQTLKARLEEARQISPEVEAFAYFLSALLAASPEDRIRDGARALVLAEALYRGYASPEHAELVAMARAELGDFAGAAEQQQRALALAMGEGRWYLLPRLAANQERFGAGRPCREPWSGGGLLGQLPPASLAKPFADYPTEVSY